MSSVFTSRWGLILAALGMAIGTGNIWRFPRVVSANGGGAFLIPWAIFLFTWSIPLLMAEFAIGRRTGRGPVGAFALLFGPGTAWRGGFVALCSVGIMFYYSVVAGWTLRYLWLALSGGLSAITADNGTDVFVSFTSSYGPLFTHLLAIGAACLVVAAGVVRGIERACRLIVPLLFVVLVVAAVRSLTLDGSGAGVEYLFHVDWTRLAEVDTWLEALTQSAWDTGAGWGLMCCYAIYAGRGLRARRECMTTGLGNNTASLLAALAILPAVFALAAANGQEPLSMVQQSGPANTGLTFIWIPVLFRQMPWGGGVLGILFFLALTLAALSSLIAMVELAVRTLVDLGVTRARATAVTFGVGFLLGVPSAVDLGFIPGHKGLSFFENQDWVWGVGLIVSGGLLGLSVLGYGVRRFHKELIADPESADGAPSSSGALFRIALTWLVPLQAAGLLGWWFSKAWTWTAGAVDAPLSFGQRLAEWLDPTALFSVGTCLFQWGVVLAVLLAANRWLARRSTAGSPG